MLELNPFAPNPFLDGRELYSRVHTFNWASTPLGPPEQWSPGLHMAIEQAIVSRSLDMIDSVPQAIPQEKSHLKAQLQHFFAQAPVDISFLWGPDHILEFANDRMLELWGKTAEQVMFKPIFEGVPEAAKHGFEEILGRVYQWGERITANEIPSKLSRNGRVETVYLNFTYEPFREEDGTITGVTTAVIEVTSIVLARKKAEESEKQKNGILNSLSSQIAVLDHQGEIVLVNKAWDDFALENGGRKGLGLGENYVAVLDRAQEPYAEAAPFISKAIKAVLNGELSSYSLEYPCHSPTQQRWFIVEVFPLACEDGGAVVTHTNISERRLAEDALRESEQRLRLLSETLDEQVREHTRLLAEITEQLRQKE